MTAWIVALAIGACAAPKGDTDLYRAGASSPEFRIWQNQHTCLSALEGGDRLARSADRFRIGTWNVRWFPDGKPGKEPNPKNPTDVEWMACVIAYLNLDVMGLQEIKLTDRGHAALGQLTQRLQDHTGALWKWVPDSCEAGARQHVVLLYRTDRADLSEVASYSEIDPTSKEGRGTPGCSGYLRPALGAYVRSRAGGVDFHMLTTHLDAGRKKRDFDHREQAWTLLSRVEEQRFARVADRDMVLVGDFNTAGCDKCSTTSPGDEVHHMRQVLAGLPHPWALPRPSHPCTQYFFGHGKPLDHITHTESMAEAAGSAPKVAGPCALASCDDIDDRASPALQQLSDHCPVIMDIHDADSDTP